MPLLGNDMSHASFGFEDLGLRIADDSSLVGLRFAALSDTDKIGWDLLLVSLLTSGAEFSELPSFFFTGAVFEEEACFSPPRSFFCRDDDVRCLSTDGRTLSLLLARPAPAPKKSNAAKMLVTWPMLVIAMIRSRGISSRAAARDGRLVIAWSTTRSSWFGRRVSK